MTEEVRYHKSTLGYDGKDKEIIHMDWEDRIVSMTEAKSSVEEGIVEKYFNGDPKMAGRRKKSKSERSEEDNEMIKFDSALNANILYYVSGEAATKMNLGIKSRERKSTSGYTRLMNLRKYYRKTKDQMPNILAAMNSLKMEKVTEDPIKMWNKIWDLNEKLADIEEQEVDAGYVDAEEEEKKDDDAVKPTMSKDYAKSDVELNALMESKLPKEQYKQWKEATRKNRNRMSFVKYGEETHDYWERNIEEEVVVEKAFNINTYGGKNGCGTPGCKRKGHSKEDCFLNPDGGKYRPELANRVKNGSKITNEHIKCFDCGETGHKSSQCPKRKEKTALQSLFCE